VDVRGLVVDERVVASVSDLPVVSQRRADDGTILQVVGGASGPYAHVVRDPIGRFVTARLLDARPARRP
jgi:hypothetical protein